MFVWPEDEEREMAHADMDSEDSRTTKNPYNGDAFGQVSKKPLKGVLERAYTTTSPLTRYYNTERSNKKILDHSLKGIRDKYRASQKSMPVSKP